MNLAQSLITPTVHDAQAMRRAGADVLALAMMEARSRTLAWTSVFEGLGWPGGFVEFDPPLWLIGHVAWFQEYWIARHLQRARGEEADDAGLRLASCLEQADGWFDARLQSRQERWTMDLPDRATLHAYLETTLESSLELLDRAEDTDAGLHVFRLALHHEDLMGEKLAVLAQALDLEPARLQPVVEGGFAPAWPALAPREALVWPEGIWRLGSSPGGWVPQTERWAHPVAVPAGEMDAQPVNWAQYVEFIHDGGYDTRRWWSDAGWEWLEASGRRAPRYIEQVAGGVLARQHGRMQRMAMAQPVRHVSAHEAEAWCRWAGRRLPTEAEWERAAMLGPARGHRWGQVLEWVAGEARPWSGGHAPRPGQRVLRGASLAGSLRLAHPRARRCADAAADALFCGFRSCSA